MNWITFANIAAQNIPIALHILDQWTTNQTQSLTRADYEALASLNNETAETKIIKAAASKAIPANDPRVLALLSAVPAP